MGKNLRIELHLGYLELSFISLTTDKEAESLDGLVVGGQVRELDNYLNSSYTHAIQLFTSSCHVRGRTLNALVDIVDQVVDLEPVTRDQLEDAEKASNHTKPITNCFLIRPPSGILPIMRHIISV